MEERRSNGFRVKPSFGQVLGYIQEGEPLTLDLPNRKASIYTSSHFYLDDYPNAPEPVSETPLPHTSLNPAAAFETADEGYSGTPFPRPPREFTRPSFLPDSDDGGMDPGQALRNDGLNPPRPPTLGGRLRESGIQAAETVIAGAAAGAAAATGPARRRRLAGQNCENPQAATGTGTTAGRSAGPANHREAQRSGALVGAGGPKGGGGGTASRPGHRELRFPAGGSIGSLRHCCGGSGGSSGGGCGGGGGRWRPGAAGRRSPGDGGSRGCGDGRLGGGGSRCCSRRHGVGHRRRAQCGFAPDGLGRCNRRRHGQRRLAAEHDHGRADPERDARKRSRRSLLHPGAAEGPAAGGLQDRHRVGERAQESAAATDPKPPGTAPEAPGADPFRPEQRSHPRVLRQRTVPGQPPVPRRPGTSWNPAVLRGASSGERTGSCVSM